MRDDGPSVLGRFPVKQVAVDENTAASNTIVAAVAGKSIRVISYVLAVSAAEVLTWEDGNNADLSGAMTVDASPLVAESQTGLFWTPEGVALNLLAGGTAQVSGHITYIETDI